MSINKVEATLNFSMAIGFLNANIQNDIYISMHGSVKNYKNIVKNKLLGKFLNCWKYHAFYVFCDTIRKNKK